MADTGSKMLRFARPTVRHCVLWTVAGMSLFGLFAILLPPGPRAPWLPIPIASAPWVIGMMLTGALLTFMMVVAMGTQRVEIDGTTVRVANLATLHRWRAFNVNDVTGLHMIGFHSGSLGLALVVQLAPAPHRAWRRIDLTSMRKTDGDSDIDSALFVTFFQAVLQARPGMEVTNLPPSYDGALRRPQARG